MEEKGGGGGAKINVTDTNRRLIESSQDRERERRGSSGCAAALRDLARQNSLVDWRFGAAHPSASQVACYLPLSFDTGAPLSFSAQSRHSRLHSLVACRREFSYFF